MNKNSFLNRILNQQIELFENQKKEEESITSGLSEWEKLINDFREWILKLLALNNQPSAVELLNKAETEFGWEIRHVFLNAIKIMREDTNIKSYYRNYLNFTLSDDFINDALRGDTNVTKEFKSTVDELFRRSLLYRDSKQFQDAINFTAKFRNYAPYNNMLVKIQNPSCSFYATAFDWKKKFNREIKEDARPLLILAPMHPVMLVYDIDNTEGDDLPEHFNKFATAEGDWDSSWLQKILENVKRDLIQVQFKSLSSLHGGFATTRLKNMDFKMRVVVHSDLDEKGRFAVLCHELGHIYLGHLGSDNDNWWPSRINLTRQTVEIEAECVAYIVCSRAGLTTSSDSYLACLMKTEKIPESVSYELIAKVAGKLEEMATRKLPQRKTKKQSMV